MTTPFGGMELLGRLSAGGMGEVLLARRRGAHGFEKLIAVKTIRGDLVRREDIRRMFLDEARLMARLDHPAIAQVYDFGEENDILYLAMEYVPGIVLSKLMKTRMAGLPASVASRIAIEVCRGLHAAHELADPDGKPLGVVHRDVSPHNLMFTFDGKVKILDFGIALRRGREAPETELGVVKGKATYVAPEQLAQQKVDRRSDIYSVAVVLHEMLTAKKLFSGTGNPVVDAEERRMVPPPSRLVPSLPSALDDVVMKGLELDPGKRYQDARDMALGLERCMSLIGGETCEEFASRELAVEKQSHRARLQTIANGKEVGPSQAITVPVPPAAHASPPSPPSPSPPSPPHMIPAVLMPAALPRSNSKTSEAMSINSSDIVLTPSAIPLSDGFTPSASRSKEAPPTIEERTPQSTMATEPPPAEQETVDARAEVPPARGGHVLLALFAAAVLATVVALLSQEDKKAAATIVQPPIERQTSAVVEPSPPPEEAKIAEPKQEEIKAPATATATALVVHEPPQPPPTATVAALVVPTATHAEVVVRGPENPDEDDVNEIEEVVQETPAIPPTSNTNATKPKVNPPPSKVAVQEKPQKRPQQPAPKRETFGYITCEAEPNAVVLIDGKVAGYTPIRNFKLPTGKHDIQLRKPYTRALRLERSVWIGENKRVKITSTEKKK